MLIMDLWPSQVFLPITTSLAMFGIDGETLPFRKTFVNYVVTTACFGIIMLGISTAVLKWSWHRNLAGQLSRAAIAGGRSRLLVNGSRFIGDPHFQDDELEMS
jgi:Na+/H+-dicarboxylate symporter